MKISHRIREIPTNEALLRLFSIRTAQWMWYIYRIWNNNDGRDCALFPMQYSKPMLRARRKAASSGGVFPSQRMERSSSPDLPARRFKAGLKIEIRANSQLKSWVLLQLCFVWFSRFVANWYLPFVELREQPETDHDIIWDVCLVPAFKNNACHYLQLRNIQILKMVWTVGRTWPH